MAILQFRLVADQQTGEAEPFIVTLKGQELTIKPAKRLSYGQASYAASVVANENPSMQVTLRHNDKDYPIGRPRNPYTESTSVQNEKDEVSR